MVLVLVLTELLQLEQEVAAQVDAIQLVDLLAALAVAAMAGVRLRWLVVTQQLIPEAVEAVGVLFLAAPPEQQLAAQAALA